MNAFEKYLLSIPLNKALEHMIECLRHGRQDNSAWILMKKHHGESWKCKPEELTALIVLTLNMTADEARKEMKV